MYYSPLSLTGYQLTSTAGIGRVQVALLEFRADHPAGHEEYPSFLWHGNTANPDDYLDGFGKGTLVSKVCQYTPSLTTASTLIYHSLAETGLAEYAHLTVLCKIGQKRCLALQTQGARKDPQHHHHYPSYDRLCRMYGTSKCVLRTHRLSANPYIGSFCPFLASQLWCRVGSRAR